MIEVLLVDVRVEIMWGISELQLCQLLVQGKMFGYLIYVMVSIFGILVLVFVNNLYRIVFLVFEFFDLLSKEIIILISSKVVELFLQYNQLCFFDVVLKDRI